MTDREALKEKVARAMWTVATDLKQEMREAVWNGTHPRASAYLADDDPALDEDLSPFLCTIGRNTFRGLADAAIDLAFGEAARVADLLTDDQTRKALGANAVIAASTIAAALRAYITDPGTAS